MEVRFTGAFQALDGNAPIQMLFLRAWRLAAVAPIAYVVKHHR